ncbi:MAG TPA: GGDEF domain-containing protein [Patescibacteria group bacterium]|nr:GGDEF domain-containing protein [Patescibacteria group bacterium]
MDARLVDLLACWSAAVASSAEIDEPLEPFSHHADNLLIIDTDGALSRYRHYGRAFVAHFGADLTGRIIDMLPTEILPADRRGMLAFEYTFARQVQRPLWRSYTARFGNGEMQTWQRLVLPAGGGRLVVGAYRDIETNDNADGVEPAVGLLRLLIERVPVVVTASGQVEDLALSLKTFCDTQQHVAELEVLASRDELTGVANLRHFHYLATLELEHARRMGRAFSVLALDLDHFKRINDTWGHAVGDEALQAFASACRIVLREPDILGRCGGEEFAVALPNTSEDGARVIAERLREQVEQILMPLPQGDAVRFTVSAGIATAGIIDDHTADTAYPSVAALLARADVALYRSKARGRNCVSVATADDIKASMTLRA